MGVTKRSLSASGTWLVRHVMHMAKRLSAKKVLAGSKKQIIEGYLLIAKKSGSSLSAVVIDLPAWLCLIGRYLGDGGSGPYNRYYVQTLPMGRDSYLSGFLDGIQDSQDNPSLTAGEYESISVGFSGIASDLIPTRYWGLAQPFQGVGAIHSLSTIESSENRWPMAYATPNDAFAWRLIVVSPFNVRVEDGVVIPENPSAVQASWTLNIGESALRSVGAKAITRLLDSPIRNYELNWEAAQYPWISTGRPQSFFNEDGIPGYRITVVAQVVYEEAGPYYWYGSSERERIDQGGSWSEEADEWALNGLDSGISSGARGLWAADIEVTGEDSRIINSYKIFAGDEDREPLLRDRVQAYPHFPATWYMSNCTYRSPMATLTNEDGTQTSVIVSSTFIDQTPDGYNSESSAALEFNGHIFLDINWLEDGSFRRKNVSQEKLSRGVFYPNRLSLPYSGGAATFDTGDKSEGRFTIGADTDGTVAVFPVFSCFGADDSPLLRIYVVDRETFRVGYSGVPGFAWCLARGTGEQMVLNYGIVDFPANGDELKYGEWITYPAPYDHVTYIGNSRYIFYVSSQIDQRPENNFLWGPSGNIAVAIYSSSSDALTLSGVIDSQLYNPGLGADGDFTAMNAMEYAYRAHLVPVFSNPPKLGRIEVVRPESEGFNPADPGSGGHPATLIASEGKGQPGLNLESWDGDDITQGRTWISYDSGASWDQILSYGSPAGTFHCGNIAQARTEPVVRI